MARLLLSLKPADTALGAVPQRAKGVRGAATRQSEENCLRKKRSSSYIGILTRLDAGGHVHSPQAMQALQEAICRELPEITVDALPLGIVAKCYLPPPHEVHTLDCIGLIVRHYKMGEALPPLMERARALARHPGYAFIEIYPTKLIAVSASGQTAVIED